MAEQIGSLEVGIEGNTSGLNNSIGAAQMKATNAFKKIGSVANGMITGALVAGVAAVAVGLAAGVKAAIDFEAAFAGVRKTLSGSDAELKAVSDELINMARFLPQTAAELAAIAQVGGQLGIAAKDIAQFTEVIAKLGGATDLAGEQGATSMARFMKVIGESVGQTGVYANILVALGNNMATTESEIINLALNFGALGKQVGLSGPEILAFSAAMREMGQPAAAGATALNKLFTQLNRAMLGEGGLAEFADIAGMSMFEFQALMETSMAAAAEAVLNGLNAMGEAQKDQISALDSVGLARDRVSRALISMATNEEGLAKARRIANEELFRQAALNEEFKKKQDTVAGQMDILKSKVNSFAIRMGEALLPAIKAVVKFIGRFFDGLYYLVNAFKNTSAQAEKFQKKVMGSAFVLMIIKVVTWIAKLVKNLKGMGDEIAKVTTKFGKFGKFLGKFTKFFTGAAAGAALFVYEVAKFGDLQAIIDNFSQSVDKLTVSFTFLKQNGIGGLDQLTTDVLQAMVDGMEDDNPLKAVLKEMLEGGKLDADVAKDLASTGSAISEELLTSIQDGFGVGAAGGDMKLDFRWLESIKKALAEEGLGDSQLFKDIQALQDAIRGDADKETLNNLAQQVIAKLAIVEAGKDSLTVEESLRKLITDNVVALSTASGKSVDDIKKIISTEQGLKTFVQEFGMAIEGVPALYDILFPPEKDPVQEALQQLKEDASAFKQMVADIFAPTELQFKLDFAEMDLADAHKDHADLHKELGDLHEEDAKLQQDLIDIQQQELLTHEEILKIQELELENQELKIKHAQEAAMTFEEQVDYQDKINEALEIEQRLRDGLALSANDQLRREKLRKDRRRVELAAQQGSLEFADLELKAIDENIKAIEDKAVTQTDATLARREAQEILDRAEERRLKEKEKIADNIAKIQEINLESVARRNEEIIEIEKRRADIEERLKEIPREIKEAHWDIHKAQKAVYDATADIQIGFMDLRAVGEEEMKELAKAIGMPYEMLDGLMTLLNHARVESGPIFDEIITRATDTKHTFAQDPFTGGPSVSDVQRKNYGFLQQGTGIVDFLRHGGGGFKTGNKFIAGEYGPELIKTFPGGGMVTPLGTGGGTTMQNTINLNITGLPTDPIAARRIAQNIQRELVKLEREGRSGVVR